MKKSRLLFFLLLVGIIYQISAAHSQSGVGIGLTLIDTSPPLLNFTNLVNNSGFASGNISVFFNVSDASNVRNCSLIINNNFNESNDSVIKDIEIDFDLENFEIGSYNLSINCTDEFNFSTITPEFTITVLSMEEFNGTTTNTSVTDIRDITYFALENTHAGQINFSNSSNHTDLSIGFDLDSFINISFNHISLDSNALNFLNKSATLKLYGLTFSNPRVVKDGVVCPETICKEVSYIPSGGVFTFNVTHFTSYSAEETPGGGGGDSGSGSSGSSSSGSSGSGGGGGGGPPAIAVVTDFNVDKSNLKVTLKQGQTKTETLKIKNTGTTLFDVRAVLDEIEKFKLYPVESELATSLSPNEEKTIELVFRAGENEVPDIYPATITLKSPSAEKEIATIIEVDSAQPLFDADVEVLSESKKVFPGDELLLEVNLFNVRGFGRVDVKVEYSIKDMKGNIVAAAEHETLATETQAKFTRSLSVPSDLRPGTYVAFVKVTYADSVGTSSDLFEVQAKSIRLYEIKGYGGILLYGGLAVIMGILISFGYKLVYLRRKMPAGKVDEVKQFKMDEKSQKIKKELGALESAHKSGFISEESYLKDKERLESKLK